MDESLQARIETYLSHLDGLIRRGHQLRGMLTADASDTAAMTATRRWQEDCGVTINQLSGGSKAHWLARSFSEAFLMRSPMFILMGEGCVDYASPPVRSSSLAVRRPPPP